MTANVASAARRQLAGGQDGARLYTARGWQGWRGPSSVLSPGGIRRTPDKDGALCVQPVLIPVNATGELTCGWRPGSAW